MGRGPGTNLPASLPTAKRANRCDGLDPHPGQDLSDPADKPIAEYALPEGILGLNGPVEKPAPGTLPLRGDLAHLALAGRFLVTHYAVPNLRVIGGEGAALKLTANDDAETVTQLDSGSAFEALDYAGEWCWGCCGPEGPTGYIPVSSLADL